MTHRQLSNLPVHSCDTEIKFFSGTNWHRLFDSKAENLDLYQVKNESLTDGSLEDILVETE